jgi:hypothetical protein
VSRAGCARAIGAIAAASGLFAGCDGTYDLPADVRWQSAHFDYLTRSGDSQICPDVLAPLEEHFAVLQDFLGFEWPPGAKVTYEKMLGSADYLQHGGCPADASACDVNSTVVSPDGMDLHELVHAYLSPTGSPSPVLVEGVAVVLACTSGVFGQPKPTQTWEQLAGLNYGAATRADVYDAGAWLVGYLLTQYDPRLFVSLYQRVPTGADADTMDAVFREVYGQSLATIWAAVLAGIAPHDACPWQCSRPPVPLDGTKVATDGVCGTLNAFHSLTLASDSLVAVTSTGAGVQIETCDQTALYPQWGPPGLLDLYELPTGAYFVATDGTAGTMTLDGSLSSLVTPTCAGATNPAPFAGFDGFFLSGPNTSSQWFLPLPPPPSATFRLGLGSAGGALLKVCGSCDPASCVFPPFDGSWTWAPGQTASVAVDPFPPGSYFQASFNWAY